MKFVSLIPVYLSCLLLAAHWFRAGQPGLVLPTLLVPLVLFVGRQWAARVVQAALAIGALEWIRTTVVMAMARDALGLPWARLVVILAAVTLLTIFAVFMLEPRILRKHGQATAAIAGPNAWHDDSRIGRSSRTGDT